MKKNTLLLITLFFTLKLALAQQLPLYSQYRESQTLINPGAIHVDRITYQLYTTNSAAVTYHHQWTKLRTAPKTFTARYEHIFKKYDVAVGGTLYSDNTGPIKLNGIIPRFAYQVRFDKYTFLSIGAAIGVYQHQYVASEAVARDRGDILAEQNESSIVSDFSFGGFFSTTLQNDDRFYAGLSLPQFGSFGQKNVVGGKIHSVPHIYGQVGYYKYLGDGFGNMSGYMFLEPSLWVKYVPSSPLQTDLNFRFHLSDLVSVGLGASVTASKIETKKFIRANNFSFEMDLSLNEAMGWDGMAFRLGYAMTKTVASYGTQLGYGHEFNISYAW